MENIIEKDSEYIAHTYARFPLVLKEGKGSLLYDQDGKEYIDMASGIAVASFGYGDEEWEKAVSAQAKSFPTRQTFFTQSRAFCWQRSS